MMKSRVLSPLVISAPSGAGKSTLIARLLEGEWPFAFSISSTTRSPRSGERHGKEYYFLTDDEFRTAIEKDEFLEWAEVHGRYYGTTKKEIDRILERQSIPLLDVDVQGATVLRETLKDGIFVFIVPPSMKELKRRLLARSTETDESVQLRLKNAEREMEFIGIYDYVVINDTLDEALDDLVSIVRAESLRREKMTRVLEIKNGGLN